jgi:hypothetical protein
VIFDFYRRELVADGVLRENTTQLVLTADLVDGRQIVARGRVSAK